MCHGAHKSYEQAGRQRARLPQKGYRHRHNLFWFPMPSRRGRKPSSQLLCCQLPSSQLLCCQLLCSQLLSEDQSTLLLVPTPTRLVQIPQRLCHTYQPTFPSGNCPTSRPPLLQPSLRYCKVGWQLRLRRRSFHPRSHRHRSVLNVSCGRQERSHRHRSILSVSGGRKKNAYMRNTKRRLQR